MDQASLTGQIDQLAKLSEIVPQEEEITLGLREVVIEQLHPTLSPFLELVGMEITFTTPRNFSYFLGRRGWRTERSYRAPALRVLAEDLSFQVIQDGLSAGLSELIKRLEDRKKEAEGEKDKLTHLLRCLSEIQKEGS